MAVYMFTYHAYRSWMPDRSQGYVRKGKVLPTDEEEARRYGRRACNPQITFDRTMQQTLVSNARVVCDESHWRLHQVRAIPTHLRAGELGTLCRLEGCLKHTETPARIESQQSA